jgi:Bacteriophage HK97-gp10, putative tail-component
MSAISVVNIREVIAGLKTYEEKVEKAAEFGLTRAALAIERQAKLNANTGVHPRGEGHIKGTGPGPNVVTGTLRRSITTEVRYGFGSYVATVGPTVEYARAVELGSSRWKSGVRYPYLYPAVGFLVNSGQLNRIFTSSFTSALRG